MAAPFASSVSMTLMCLAALGFAGCATGPDKANLATAARRLPNLFISPAGQPFRAAREAPYPVTAWFTQADADHDGKLTSIEFRADAAAFFKRLDTNHDGVIDGAEVQHYEQDVAPEILPRIDDLRFGEGMDLSLGETGNGGRRSRGTSRAGSGGSQQDPGAGDRSLQGAGLYSLLSDPEPVSATDDNFDGRITLKSFLAAADRRFAILDKMGRGYLIQDELAKTPAQTIFIKAAAERAKHPNAGHERSATGESP